MPDYTDVMVVGETTGNVLSPMTLELLGCGRMLANDLGEELSVLVMGSDISGAAQSAFHFGADRVYVADDPMLRDGLRDAALAAIEQAVEQSRPRIILFGQTDHGRDLAPRLSFRLGTAATLDCVALAIDPDSRLLQQTKPVYGGNALATFTCESFPQIATLRRKAVSPPAPDEARHGTIIPLTLHLDPAAVRTKLLKTIPDAVEWRKLEDARVVVSGGRGIGSAEGFKQLEELAYLLSGAVGATRSSCDNGWVPDALQIGLTGKIITPDLYIAVALSGASQHLTGVSGPKAIVAINKDPEANIFKEARFGVVGDWKEVLPAFTATVRELLAKE